jgi:hypothetical protein
MEEQLKVLMEYTKFHIGLYTTLCTLLIGIIGLGALSGRSVAFLPYLLATLICFAIAGAFGGLVGSSLPNYTKWADFEAARLGPWFLPNLIPARWAASAEHTAFWVGTVIALVGVIRISLRDGWRGGASGPWG